MRLYEVKGKLQYGGSGLRPNALIFFSVGLCLMFVLGYELKAILFVSS